MAKLPRVTAGEVIRALTRAGFSLSRHSGSHKIYKNSRGLRATVPFHAGAILHPKILKSILQDAEMTQDQLEKLLK